MYKKFRLKEIIKKKINTKRKNLLKMLKSLLKFIGRL